MPRQVFNESVPWNKSRSSTFGPQVFVVFDTNQCYPEYLFMYTDRDTVPDPCSPAVNDIQSAVHGAQLSEGADIGMDFLLQTAQPEP
jgi:hypothetical protein